MTILIICVVAAGLIMITFCVQLYKNEKFREIEGISTLFIDGLRDEFESSQSLYSDNVTRLHDGFTDNYSIDFYIYDSDGNCILSPNKTNYEPLSSSLKEEIDSGSIIQFDSNEISDKEQSILYGTRFTLNDELDIQQYYLTAYSSTKTLDAFTGKLGVCLFIVCIICIAPAAYILWRKAQKQAVASSEFLRVSEKYSKGDFSERINITVPGKLKDISNNVNLLADNVENADETSKTFIANVSHELRTPITAIGGFVDGILDGTIPKSRQQEYLVLASKEIHRLKMLISSMLNMTRFESGTLKPNFKETNLTELVIQTVLMFEKKIKDKKLEIVGLDSDRLVAEVDPDLIQQVIYNLVENAVKFVDVGGEISFTFEENKDNCSIGIKNTGEGLKNNEIQQVFDRFYKTDAPRGKDATGLGLGLSISRNIVKLHNGTIVVKSIQQEYTEFIVNLPKIQN
ncbi:MAG: HAMP domain-containing histidine kinase [Ruminococcus sp.]|nr:HAMP domain-containing histidine kinase [Ruminococcus sp.]